MVDAATPTTSLSSDSSDNAERPSYQPFSDDFEDTASVSSVSSGEANKPVPVSFDVEDKEAYKHLEKGLVVDAVTRGTVTNRTMLAALYDFNDPSIDNDLIGTLSGCVHFPVTCQLEAPDGSLFPPESNTTQPRYRIEVTFVNLVSKL
jgi:hypothetical protein